MVQSLYMIFANEIMDFELGQHTIGMIQLICC